MIGLLLWASLLVKDCPALTPRFRSIEMKKRAVREVDIGDTLKQPTLRAN
jgi:hypothetical protein